MCISVSLSSCTAASRSEQFMTAEERPEHLTSNASLGVSG